jgi:rhomboid protease GluP
LKLGQRAADRRNPGEILGGLIPHARFTTVIILIVNFAMYGATYLYSQQAEINFNLVLYIFGAKIGLRDLIASGQWWRLVTAGFLHGGLLHILMNSWVLFSVGAEVEEAYGTARMILFYFVSTVSGFLLSAWWSPGLSIGASAGLTGLIGAMIAWGVTERTAIARAVKSQYMIWAGYILVIGMVGGLFHTDNAAHIGGLAGGFAIAWMCSTPRARLMWREPLIKAGAALALAATAVAFTFMFLNMASAAQEVQRVLMQAR